MRIVRYRGGLGNQMFQYAFQLRLEQIYGKDQVYADLSHYRLNREHNGFELETAFGLELREAADSEIRKMSPYFVPSERFMRLPDRTREWLAPKLQYYYPKMKRSGNGYYRQQDHSSYEPEALELAAGQTWYLDGLWQDLRYFESVEQPVRDAFSMDKIDLFSGEDRKTEEEIKTGNSVGVHVRRGDFVNSKFDLCSAEYYREAFSLIEQKVKDPVWFFFSDDPDFVEKEFVYIKKKRILRHDAGAGILDMKLLSGCRNAVLSNSTFAFWAAWLGGHEKGTIIAPRYSLIKKEKKYDLRVPQGWIQVGD